MSGIRMIWVVIGALFALMFALNWMTPTWGDDWHRTLPAGDLKTLFVRVAWEYETWTGRLGALIPTYLLLWQYPGGALVFAVLNAGAFCLLLLGIFRNAVGRYPADNALDSVVFCAALIGVWFYTDGFGETILWKTGAVGFLWVVVATAFVIVPYVDLISRAPHVAEPASRKWLVVLPCLVTGTGLEITSAATVVLMGGALLIQWRRRQPIPASCITGAMAYLAGTVVLIGAPGNYVRYTVQTEEAPIDERLLLLIERIFAHSIFTTGLFVALALLGIALALRRPPGTDLKRFAVLFALAWLCALAMIGSPGAVFNARTAFCAEIFFIAAGIALTANLISGTSVRNPALYLPFLLASALFVVDATRTLHQYRTTWQQTQRREELMAAYRKHGVATALLPSYRIPFIAGLHDDLIRGRYFLRDVHGDMPGNGWRNTTFAEDNGFTFALRVSKPYLIYEPELDDGQAFTTIYHDQGVRLVLRREPGMIGSDSVAYLIGRPGSCDATILDTIPAAAGYSWRFDAVALVGPDGSLRKDRCAARGVLGVQ